MVADLKVLNGGSASNKSPWGSEKWANQLRQETQTLANQIETGYMKLAEKLWLIFDTPVDGDSVRAPIWTLWKDKEGRAYTTFDRYVDAELDINYKKAQRLRAIWKTFKIDLQLDDETLQRVVDLGFSKVRELARPNVLTKRNVMSWIEKAENMTYLKLATNITKYIDDKKTADSTKAAEAEYNGSLGSAPTRGPDDDEEEAEERAKEDVRRIEGLEMSSEPFSCTLYGDQIETVNLAMKRSAELSNSDKKGQNLSLICLDFLATNDFKFADENQRLRFLAKYEKLTGYKLIIIDPEAGDDGEGEVVYGIKTLEKLARSNG
jgi:hypothetical protein